MSWTENCCGQCKLPHFSEDADHFSVFVFFLMNLYGILREKIQRLVTMLSDQASRGCVESRFGCCPDDVTPASGPHNLGCTTSSKTSNFTTCVILITHLYSTTTGKLLVRLQSDNWRPWSNRMVFKCWQNRDGKGRISRDSLHGSRFQCKTTLSGRVSWRSYHIALWKYWTEGQPEDLELLNTETHSHGQVTLTI